jgi:hypothetical protein
MEFISLAEVLSRLEEDRYLSVAEAARYLGICERALRARLAAIPHFRTPKILFRRSELDRWMEQFRQLPEQQPDLDRVAAAAVKDILGDANGSQRNRGKNERNNRNTQGRRTLT